MDEQAIKERALTVVEASKAITITNEQDYTTAAEFLKQVKSSGNAVKEFFRDMKVQAAAAHKAICDKEKSYLNPLSEAESHIKRLMSAYVMEQGRIRREKEAELRRKQEEVARKAADEAAKLEAQGKKEEAEATLDMAVQIENLKPVVELARPKIQGVAYAVDYDVEVVSAALVPVNIMGVELRPVDLSAVKRIVKAAKGKVQIPGIRITETKSMRVRA